MKDSISLASDDLKERSDSMPVFELGVFHMQQKGNEENEFLLVGLNESSGEAVEIFESWESEWRDSIRRVSSDPMDQMPSVVVYEYREV